MEQTLGHVTVARNLRAALDAQNGVGATWLPIPFEMGGVASRVPLYGNNWSVRASWRARACLAKTLAAQRHDAVLFHTQVTSLFSVPLMRRVPSVVSLDATPVNFDSIGTFYGHRPEGAGPLDRLKRAMNKASFQSARSLVSWSDWAKQSLVADYGVQADRVHVIAPGAAPAFFEIGERRLSGAPRTDRGPVKLLFVGGDFERKGGPQLLSAMRSGLASRCELHVVTQRDVAPEPGVHIHRGLGPNSAELLRLFEEADVFVLPTLADCLAIVLMEAAAAALPVITTSVGGLSEAVIPGESGLVVPPGDAAALQRAVEDLAGHPARRRRMARAGYELARDKFDSRKNNQRVLQLVAQVAGAN
jgi:glycosyltransferase involved in cell wall biosynthesis